MNRKRGKLLRIGLLSAALLAAAFFLLVPSAVHARKARLVVNGQIIEDPNVTVYRRGDTTLSELPFLSVLEALGLRVNREDASAVRIWVGEEEFLLRDHKIVTGSGKVLTRISGHSLPNPEEAVQPGEIYVEHGDMKRILELMGISDVEFEIRFPEKRVTVSR